MLSEPEPSLLAVLRAPLFTQDDSEALGYTIDHLTTCPVYGEKSRTLLFSSPVDTCTELGRMDEHGVCDEVPDHEAQGHRMQTTQSGRPRDCELQIPGTAIPGVRSRRHASGTPPPRSFRLLLSLAVSKPPRGKRQIAIWVPRS